MAHRLTRIAVFSLILWGSVSARLLAAQGLPSGLSREAQALVARAFEGLDPSKPIVDVHVHAIGIGQGDSGCRINPTMLDPRYPLKRYTSTLYLRASGVKGFDRFDEDYMERLVALAQGFGRPVKLHVLAMDQFHNPDGTINPERTEFFVPNDYVVRLAERHPDVFVPVISVHPARPDALAELDRWGAKGVRWVKWLPNAQGIDPADPRWDPFYRRMRDLGMILLSHTGEEQAVSAKGAQELGNPLRLRRPLDLGVTVVMAHCASLGWNEDLDHPGRKVRSFDLFLRLMGEEAYRGRLYGDLSAVTQINRPPRQIWELLQRKELQGRLLQGSDYPLPGVDLVIWTSQFKGLNMISARERQALNEIFEVNPLLFDFVLKRLIRDPKTGRTFDPELFTRVPAPPRPRVP